MPALRLLLARPLLRRIGLYILIAAAVALFLFNLRKSGEHIGRLTERLATKDQTHDTLQDMLDAAARRPNTPDALTQRLRDGTF